MWCHIYDMWQTWECEVYNYSTLIIDKGREGRGGVGLTLGSKRTNWGELKTDRFCCQIKIGLSWKLVDFVAKFIVEFFLKSQRSRNINFKPLNELTGSWYPRWQKYLKFKLRKINNLSIYVFREEMFLGIMESAMRCSMFSLPMNKRKSCIDIACVFYKWLSNLVGNPCHIKKLKQNCDR